MTGALAALAAGAAVLLALRRPTPAARIEALRADVAAPRPAHRASAGGALTGVGGALRRLAGGRADARLDRAAGAALAVGAAALLVGPVPALLGPAAWHLVARGRRLRRQAGTRCERDVSRELPDLVDLLALAVGAGLPVPAALPTVAPLTAGALRPDLLRAADALAAGQASDAAVVELGRRWGPAARPLVHALTDHLRYGTPVLPALERVAVDARAARRRQAETRARRLPVLLLFPLVLCTLPAFGLLTVAPLVAGTFDALRGGHLEAPASAAP